MVRGDDREIGLQSDPRHAHFGDAARRHAEKSRHRRIAVKIGEQVRRAEGGGENGHDAEHGVRQQASPIREIFQLNLHAHISADGDLAGDGQPGRQGGTIDAEHRGDGYAENRAEQKRRRPVRFVGKKSKQQCHKQ